MELKHVMALFEAEVRMTEVHCLAGVHSNGFSDDDFLDNLEYRIENSHESMQVFADFPFDDEEGELGEFLEWLTENALYGYIVKAETPIPTKFHTTSSYSFSWGYCRSQYFYVEAVEDAVDLAVAWAEEVVETERKKG